MGGGRFYFRKNSSKEKKEIEKMLKGQALFFLCKYLVLRRFSLSHLIMVYYILPGE